MIGAVEVLIGISADNKKKDCDKYNNRLLYNGFN